MRIALVNSLQDVAGQNIRHHIEHLLAEEGGAAWRPNGHTYDFYDVNERLIHAGEVDRGIEADLLIFLSRHSSVNPVPVLTVHVTGNYGVAELGGSPRTLAPAAPAMMQATLRALARHCPEGYRVSYEVTHHGPTSLSHPSFFVEIGSTETEWTDPVAGRAVAKAVLSAVPVNTIPLIGIGGTHYAPRETEIALTTRGAFGHIASSLRQAAVLDKEMVQEMIRQSGAVAAYVDRKSLSRPEFERLTGILDSLELPRLSESEIAALGHLPWETWCAIRKMADAVSPGARCFSHALAGAGTPVLERANPDLLAETVKADEPGLIKNLDNLPLVHLSTRDNRLLPEFITYPEFSPEIIHALNTLCVKIIRSKEITATERDFLIITKIRFDPGKARELGVMPGPSYHELAGGRPVVVDDRTITPEMVSSRSEVRIHIPGLEKFS
ncbi:D-aminoacyl-tRNA deacylase [Methanoregula sp.]|uniref:D-aminoacyl-tRNA deacylase n=1 Tax=Methanoregula sp. TaxID=2052170 RepID=UPI00236CC19A|nr:D-aminoacyl-tRNA deacylase [Methanoregula sp.]MDD1687476.1 D-tyrosyl-tRNA(Tyr) deacylase [Methanoregula sp.]